MLSSNTVLCPEGNRTSTCGYCSPPGQRSATNSSYSTGVTSSSLGCDVYKAMLDRGWRRSGVYIYKPDLRRSCCPQYTIRLNADAFNPSKSQKKLLRRWNKFVLEGEGDSESMDVEDDRISQKNPKKSSASGSSKSHGSEPSSWLEMLHASELELDASTTISGQVPAHEFEVFLEPSSYTDEKYKLFYLYQREIHKDMSTPGGFKRFLVDSPLNYSRIPYPTLPPPSSGLPIMYGSYHQLYKLDGKLVAMAVLDILPGCISSVYFMYDPPWQKYSFGKISALREAALAREIHTYLPDFEPNLYMGFYIHSCPKMRYKGEYSPSFLLDPEDYSWHPLQSCIPQLNQHRYACFSNSEKSTNEVEDPRLRGRYEFLMPRLPSRKDLSECKFLIATEFTDVQEVPVTKTMFWDPGKPHRAIIAQAIAGLGIDIAKQVLLTFQF